MTTPTIHKSKIGEHILLLELDNPPANSLSAAMKKLFLELLAEIEVDPTIRVLIISGKGNKFCVGDDLKQAMSNASTKGKIINNLKKFSEVIDRVEALTIPTIAAINGWCIGGGLELALCCDIRIAADNSNYIAAGVNVGLTASGYRLPRIIGIGPAKRILLTGDKIDAQQALRFGLVTDLYPREMLIEAATRLAKVIASKAPLALKATKQIANTALDLTAEESIVAQQHFLEELSESADHQEALIAFNEKRAPRFRGC